MSPDSTAPDAEDREVEAQPTPRIQHRHVTIEEVAAAAGVSPATVSRVFYGTRPVREANRVKVLETARRIGYAPNSLASSLRTRSSLFIGMIVPDIAHIFYARAVKGAQAVLRDAGYQVLVISSEGNPDAEDDAFQTMLAHRVAGMLIATTGGCGPANVPIVFFDQIQPDGRDGQVMIDNAGATKLLVNHMIGHGHTRIAFLGGPQSRTNANERRAAFQEALARAWVAVPPEYIRDSDVEFWSADSGERATHELFKLDPQPTAILAASDRLAVGALRALRDLDKRVPDDVALACYHDPLWGDIMDPPLTTVRIAARELGARAAQLLLDRLSEPGPSTEVRVPVELVVRRSCGCTPSREEQRDTADPESRIG